MAIKLRPDISNDSAEAIEIAQNAISEHQDEVAASLREVTKTNKRIAILRKRSDDLTEAIRKAHQIEADRRQQREGKQSAFQHFQAQLDQKHAELAQLDSQLLPTLRLIGIDGKKLPATHFKSVSSSEDSDTAL